MGGGAMELDYKLVFDFFTEVIKIILLFLA